MKHFVSAALSFLVWLSPITWLSIVFRFNGPQSDRERSEQAHYERLAGVAYSHARQERTRQATSA